MTKAEMFGGPMDGQWVDAPTHMIQLRVPQMAFTDVADPQLPDSMAVHLYERVSVHRFRYVGIE